MSELRKAPERKKKDGADERNIMSELRKTPEGKEKHPTDEEIECQNFTKLQKEKRSIMQMKEI